MAKREDEEFELKLSMLEIYNENVYDLLVDPPKRASDRKKLEIRKRSNGGVFVQGLKRVEVASMETVEQVMTAGSKNRAAGSHDMNEHSSRSHLVLAIHVRLPWLWLAHSRSPLTTRVCAPVTSLLYNHAGEGCQQDLWSR